MSNRESAPEPTEEQQNQIDHMVDNDTANYAEAYEMVMGTSSLGKAATRRVIDKGSSHRMPGKPNKHQRPSSVRDFADGGREDQYRGGMKPPATPEARKAYEKVAPELSKIKEKLLRDRIQTDYLNDKLSYREAIAQIRHYFGDRTEEIVAGDLGHENERYKVKPRRS